MLRPPSLTALSAAVLPLAAALLVATSGCRRADRTPDAEAVGQGARAAASSTSAMLDSERDKLLRPALLVERLQVPVAGTVADLGAGPGYLTLRLARAVGPAGHVVATDVDGAALATLRRRAIAEGVTNVETRVVAPDDPGLAPSSVDLALLCHVTAFLPDRAAWLRRLAPSLRPHGRLAVVEYVTERGPLLAAAEAAGWRVVDEAPGLLPMHLFLFLAPPAAPASPARARDGAVSP